MIDFIKGVFIVVGGFLMFGSIIGLIPFIIARYFYKKDSKYPLKYGLLFNYLSVVVIFLLGVFTDVYSNGFLSELNILIFAIAVSLSTFFNFSHFKGSSTKVKIYLILHPIIILILGVISGSLSSNFSN
jgi:uncharacterized membrane protein